MSSVAVMAASRRALRHRRLLLGRLIRLSEPGLANLDLLKADATARFEEQIWGSSFAREVATRLQRLEAVGLSDALATIA